MRKRTVVAGLFLVAALGGFSACGGSGSPSSSPAKTAADASPAGDIPDSQVFVTYKPPTGAYTVTIPEGWARKDLATGAQFTDKFNTVTVEETAASTAPTATSVKTNDFAQLRAANSSFVLGDVSTVTRTVGDAIRTTYTVNGAPDPTTGKSVTLAVERYEFWKDGKLVTITVSGAQGADNVDPWRVVTDSFRWVP